MVKHNLRAFLRHPLLAGEAGVNHPFRIALIDCPSRRVSAGPPGANWLAVLSSRGRIHWQAEPTRRNGWDGAAILTPGQGTPLTGGEGMEIEEFVKRRTDAAEEFNLHEGRSDGVEIAGSLAGGLTILRDVLYKRLHEDVQRQRGMDSILAPILGRKERTAGQDRNRVLPDRRLRRGRPHRRLCRRRRRLVLAVVGAAAAGTVAAG